MQRLPYNKRSHWTIQRAGTIVLLGISLFILKYIFDVAYEVYLNNTLNIQLSEEKNQLLKEQEILNEINERLENDETYKEVYRNANHDDIIYLP
jgi:site-specific DNA-adenine methylase